MRCSERLSIRLHTMRYSLWCRIKTQAAYGIARAREFTDISEWRLSASRYRLIDFPSVCSSRSISGLEYNSSHSYVYFRLRPSDLNCIRPLHSLPVKQPGVPFRLYCKPSDGMQKLAKEISCYDKILCCSWVAFVAYIALRKLLQISEVLFLCHNTIHKRITYPQWA